MFEYISLLSGSDCALVHPQSTGNLLNSTQVRNNCSVSLKVRFLRSALSESSYSDSYNICP